MAARGLIILGNARVGKSYLVNVLAGTEFEHKISATAVTTELQKAEIPLSDGSKLFIFNLPGLVDLQNDETMERNRAATREAFVLCPNSVIGFVFKWKNGSVALEDVTAFNAVNKAYNIQEGSLLFIVNQSESADPKVEAELTLMLRKLTNKPNVKVEFVPQIQNDDQAQKDRVHVNLLSQLTQLKPALHQESKETPLDLNGNAEEVKALENQLKQLEGQLKEKDSAMDAERAKVQAQLDQQAKDLENTKKDLEEARKNASGGGGGGSGIFSHVGKALDKIFGF